MDDLLDLNWSASHSTQKAATPSLQQSPSNALSSLSFDSLAKPSGSSSNPGHYSHIPLRSPTPNVPPSAVGRNKASGRATGSRAATPLSTTPVLPSSSDAFSGLLSLPSAASGSNTSKSLSLAERQAQLAQDKQKQVEHERLQFHAHRAFWDTLGSGAQSRPVKETPSIPFGDLIQPGLPPSVPLPTSRVASPNIALSPAPPRPASIDGNFFDDDDLLSAPSSSKMSQKSHQPSRKASPIHQAVPADPWDFDALSASVDRDIAHPKNGVLASGLSTPRSDPDLVEGIGAEESDDDMLGNLAKPAPGRRKVESVVSLSESDSNYVGIDYEKRTGARSTHNDMRLNGRNKSPPPHVVGRIVEMGFSPEQARDALAKTSDGLDVEAALDMLLGEQSSHFSGHDEDELRVERERAYREEEERERRRRRRAGPSRDSVKPRTRSATEVAEHVSDTDKILAQASEIGQSVLSKASLFWNSSKEKAIKAYEEQRKVIEAGEGMGPRKAKPHMDGRPRWMVESDEDGMNKMKTPGRENSHQGFRDDDEGTSTTLQPSREASSGKSSIRANGIVRGENDQHAANSFQDDDKPASYRSTQERIELHLIDKPKQYVSASSHPKPSTFSMSSSKTVSPVAPALLPMRTLVPAEPSQIAMASTSKAKGNEHFSALPEGHLHLIPLYNNRAATRLKLGQSSSAASDCTTVIDLIGPSYHPSKEAPLPSETASEVKLEDALVKATIKRAQAWEMGEKWKLAENDWERIMTFDTSLLGAAAISTRRLASEGVRRSKAMINGYQTPAKPKSTPSDVPTRRLTPSSRPIDLAHSQAVTTLRKANRAADAEEEQRLSLKDAVDGKILGWKGGKETNLRALISSLDMVLWDGILAGGLKVGMLELITDKQVKIKYMKVIAKLHPDKLDVKSTSLEQRMLANGAFSALNDAQVSSLVL